MKTTKFVTVMSLRLAVIGLVGSLALTGCLEKGEGNGPDTQETPGFFDYSTSELVSLNVNYGTTLSIPFEVYTSDPLQAQRDGEPVDPLYRGTTGEGGNFDSKISVPSYVKELYVYSAVMGTLDKFNVNGGLASAAPVNAAKANISRALTEGGFNYPDGYLILGEWTQDGQIGYKKTSTIDPDILDRINKSYTRYHMKYDPEYVSPEGSNNMDIDIVKATAVDLVFISSGASYNNTVGYYTYPTGSKPATAAGIENPVIAFPRITITKKSDGTMAPIQQGDQVSLKYYNAATGQFEDTFPAGVSIGFFEMSDTFRASTGNVNTPDPNRVFYSSPEYNYVKEDVGQIAQRTVAMYDGGKMVALGFEDVVGNGFEHQVWGYTDALFYVLTEEDGSISPGLPQLPEDPNDPKYLIPTEYKGTIAFEDNWPSKGDYDMNDMVIYYHSTVWKSYNNNRVVKLEDKFWVMNNGATYVNGFGYQLTGIDKWQLLDDAKSQAQGYAKAVTIKSRHDITSQYMASTQRGSENGQKDATVILFDDVREVMTKKDGSSDPDFEVVTLFPVYGQSEIATMPPYNPFIVVQRDASNYRNREVHLPNYKPTDKVDTSLFGWDRDRSVPAEGIYYVSADNYPFAIHIANEYFKWPNERTPIDEAYPKFRSWANSNGASDADWYLYPGF